jgi:hypothetical protein
MISKGIYEKYRQKETESNEKNLNFLACQSFNLISKLKAVTFIQTDVRTVTILLCVYFWVTGITQSKKIST